MAACTFFGHRDCPDSIKTKLQEVLVELIINQDVDMFYVGNQGQFDATVRHVLLELKEQYPQINFAVVLAYMPGKKNANQDFSNTMLPEGIEIIHPRFAIAWRNEWMLRQSQFLVAYVTHPWGGAYRYLQKAEQQGKQIIHLET